MVVSNRRSLRKALQVGLLLLPLLGLCLITCQALEEESSNLLNIASWAYQLQNANIDEISESGFQLIVIDYSKDGSDENKYFADEIQKIKTSGKIPVAYISIGEAEDYRFYWKEEWNVSPPSWLGKENPAWEGNYPVKYWYAEWKAIVFEYLDKILEQGFSGVYLDRVDVFEYWSDPENGEDIVLSEEEAAKRMINFVAEIAEYCRERSPEFIVIPQNGERLLEFDYNGTYLSTISGIGVEDLWYNGTVSIEPEITDERLQYIDVIKSTGKIVLSVDYVDDGTGYTGENKMRIDDYISKALSKQYIPYAARCDRELDELNIIPSVQPPVHPPVANFTVLPPFPQTNMEIVFNASNSYDPDGYIVNYTWNFGDGNFTSTNHSTVIHIYTSPGEYTVTLTITDNDGLSNSTSRILQIRMLGDVNEDGSINFNDLIAVLNLILEGSYDAKADINGDSIINFNDLIGVLNAILQRD
jgi:cysteinyl-tRNA synthetase